MSKNQGFTLIELLLVIAIIAILATGMIAVGQRFLVNNYLDNKTNELISLLQTAQLNTMAGKEDSTWGVFTSSSEMVLFKGTDYASRDTDFDTSFAIPASIGITADEVVFEIGSGNPDSAVSFTITGSGKSDTITVNSLGVIDVN